jgi:aryl-alcohol dehydrogenase-like predicted oxidoreductase
LGLKAGQDPAEAVRVVREAVDRGVTFFDTATAYKTEETLGEGLKGVERESVAVSSKISPGVKEPLLTARQLTEGVEASLRRLGTDYIDIYHFHALRPHVYDYCLAELVPEMIKLRDQGKVRFMGVTEIFHADTGHEMLQRAVRDDCWDVMMVGHNLVNQSARERVLRATREKNIGVLIMFAVRRALSRPETLRELIADLKQRGRIDADAVPDEDPLGFLVHEAGATSLPDAAYRFARHEPGVHVVLSGTGNPAHVRENAASLARPPLPAGDVERLKAIFARVDDVTC